MTVIDVCLPVAVPQGIATGSGTPWPWIAAVGVLALSVLILTALCLVVLARARRLRAQLNELVQAGPRQPAAHPSPPARADRALVAQLIELIDLASSPPVIAQGERILTSLGIAAMPVAAGDQLDLRRHTVVNSEPTGDSWQNERVSAVLRRGWVEGDDVVRPASVTVWVTQ